MTLEEEVAAEYLTLLRGELVQVASVSMRWLAATDRELRSAPRHERTDAEKGVGE